MSKITTSIAFLLLFVMFFSANAQVRTNFNNAEKITTKGKFNKSYGTEFALEVAKKDINELLEKEKTDYAATNEDKPFRLATAIPIDIDIAKQVNWSFENEFAYGKLSIRLNGALSSSINFDKFNLPSNTEMYIYNENGNMITGPITEKENNPNNVWGSWVYKGEYLNIEIKTPIATYKKLVLHSNNIAYGFKQVYQTETAGFGSSEPCNINVICPLGTGWEAERNSVALVLSDNGQDWCSGAMVMNTCNTNRPFFLTANHCFLPTGLPQQNVTAWRFMFQAWSPTCPHPGINNDGVTYNGSTLRANWAGTDFCLVELNNTPPANSGINYAGWSRNTTGISQTTIIHHPVGDVMKISRDIQAPVFDNFSAAQCWRLGLDNGATQGGSSGSPYFDQNHRIIGQHYGIDDGNLPVCNRSRKFGGRFDLSWTGGGTNATRLSNWLDPTGTGAFTTNTTNILNLPPPVNSGLYSISGSRTICNSATYSITPALPPNISVVWSVNNSSFVVAQNTPGTNQGTVTVQGNVSSATLTASITGCGNTGTAVLPINQPYPYSTCSGGSGIVRTATFPTLVPSNCTISVSLNLSPGASVVYTSQGSGPSNVPPTFWNYSTATGMLSFQIPFGVNGVAVSFTISNNNCSNGIISFYAFSSGGRFSFTAAPNPVQQTLIINANEIPPAENTKTVALTANEKAAIQFTINVYDVNTNRLLLTQRSSKGSMQQQLNVSQLKPGYYVVEITEGINKQSIKFLKE